MIDPNAISTIRVDQLPQADFNLTDNIAHEVGQTLKRGTVQNLVDLVATVISTSGGIGYIALSVTDGDQLPDVPADPSFFLAGAGTYLNINGFPDLVCTAELNAIMSLTDHWEIAVEIPIIPDVPASMISQSITNGVQNYSPSEDAVFDFAEQKANKVTDLSSDSDTYYPSVKAVNNGLSNKADLIGGKVPTSQLPSYVDDVVEVANLSSLPTTGETGKIYVTIDTNKTYRWTGTIYVEFSAGVSDHTLLTNIGTNTHAQIDTHITSTNNPHSVTKAQVGLSDVPNLSFSGSNTGDETTSSIQTKRPLKTIEGQSLEGTGNIDLTKSDIGLSNVDNTSDLNKPVSTATRNLLNSVDEFYIDENDILRLNVSTYRQVEIATQVNQTFTLDFEPTFFYSVLKDGISLLQNQYVYTAPNQIQILTNSIGQTIEMVYDKFIIQPTVQQT